MSNERLTLLVTLLLGVPALVFTGIQAWDVLDRRGIMTAAVAVSVWVISVVMIGYSVWRNLHDAHRAKALRTQIEVLKKEHSAQVKALEVEVERQKQEAGAWNARCAFARSDREIAEEKSLALKQRMEKNIPRAVKLEHFAADASALASELENMLKVAVINGCPIPPELEHPLSGDIYNLEIKEWNGFPVNVWKFQEDFKWQRDRIRARTELIPNVKSIFPSAKMTLPSERTSDEILRILKEFAEELKEESDRLWKACYGDSSAAGSND